MNPTKTYRRYLAILLLLVASQLTWASCSLVGLPASSQSFQGGTLGVFDRTPGAPIDTPAGPLGGPAASVTCTSPTAYLFFKFAAPMTTTGYTDVYATSVPGIGVKVWGSDANASPVYITNNGVYVLPVQSTGGGPGAYRFDVALSNIFFQYVVSGRIQPSKLNVPLATIEGWINDASLGAQAGAVLYGKMALGVNLDVFTKACSTPNVTVRLGSHKESEFSGVRTVSSSTSFNLLLNNCDPGSTSASYKLNPLAFGGGYGRQYVILDGSSSAEGIGIQLLDANDAPIQFDENIGFPGYNSTGGNYSIPMKARYIQIYDQIKPGSANASVQFTLSYQ